MALILELDFFEHMLEDMEPDEWPKLVGTLVRWQGSVGTVTILETGTVALAIEFVCSECLVNKHLAYVCRGEPGWVYVFDRQGHFEADIREQSLVCGSCSQSEKEFVVNIVTLIFPKEEDLRYFPGRPPRPGREALN